MALENTNKKKRMDSLRQQKGAGVPPAAKDSTQVPIGIRNMQSGTPHTGERILRGEARATVWAGNKRSRNTGS